MKLPFRVLVPLMLVTASCDEPPAKNPYNGQPIPTTLPGQKPPEQGGPQYVAPPPPPPPVGVPSAPATPQMNAQAMAAYNDGVQAFANADLNGAALAFSRATQADPQAYKAFYSLGVVQERLGNFPAAQTAYQKSFGVQADFTDGMVAYAMLLAKQNNLSEADSFLTQKRGAMAKSAALAAALAEVKSLNNDSASAQNVAQEALKLDPSFAPAMMVIARDHWRGRRLDLSLYALRAIVDGFGEANPPRDKNNAEAHLLRATILLEQDRQVAAIEAFKKAMELRPDLVVARLRVATYLLGSGGAAEAVPLLQKTLQYDNDNLTAHLSLGEAYRLTGEYAKAKEEFEWVKGKNASLPDVHFNTGLLYALAPKIDGMTAKEQIDAAVASLNKYKELVPKNQQGDADELIKKLGVKKAELDALAAASAAAAAAPPPPPPPPPEATSDASAAPPADGSKKPPETPFDKGGSDN
jgi:tetratricopeptide (TPR) repeat protein